MFHADACVRIKMAEINHEGKFVILSSYNNLFLGDTKTLKRDIHYDRTKHKEIRKQVFFLFKASILLFEPADVQKTVLIKNMACDGSGKHVYLQNLARSFAFRLHRAWALMNILPELYDSLSIWVIIVRMLICRLIFLNQLFRKILLGIPSECQTVLDPDQVRRFVGPDLGPNCVQKLSSDDTSWQRLNLRVTT